MFQFYSPCPLFSFLLSRLATSYLFLFLSLEVALSMLFILLQMAPSLFFFSSFFSVCLAIAELPEKEKYVYHSVCFSDPVCMAVLVRGFSSRGGLLGVISAMLASNVCCSLDVVAPLKMFQSVFRTQILPHFFLLLSSAQ